MRGFGAQFPTTGTPLALWLVCRSRTRRPRMRRVSHPCATSTARQPTLCVDQGCITSALAGLIVHRPLLGERGAPRQKHCPTRTWMVIRRIDGRMGSSCPRPCPARLEGAPLPSTDKMVVSRFSLVNAWTMCVTHSVPALVDRAY